MSAQQEKNQNIITIAVALFIALFTGILLFYYSPWDGPIPEVARQAAVEEVAQDTPVVQDTQVVPDAQDTAATEPVSQAIYNGEMPVIELELKSGTVTIQMRPDLAPKHVAQIVELTNKGFYDGIVFHRVIAGFMAQTGDPTGTGMGGSELPDIAAEFTDTPFVRGTVGMARSQDPDSANSQFFIVYDDAGFLDGQYTVVGEVISGMEYVDAITKGSESANGTVENPDKIISMRVVGAQ